MRLERERLGAVGVRERGQEVGRPRRQRGERPPRVEPRRRHGEEVALPLGVERVEREVRAEESARLADDALHGEPELAEPALGAREARPRLLHVEGGVAREALLASAPPLEALLELVAAERPALEPRLAQRHERREAAHRPSRGRQSPAMKIVERIFQPARTVPLIVPEIFERPPPRLR